MIFLLNLEHFLTFRSPNDFTSPQDIAVDIAKCAKCDSCAHDCQLCYPCLSKNDKNAFQRAYLEHQLRGEFQRINPTSELLKSVFLTEKTRKMADWFDAKCKMDEEWC